MNQEKMKSTAKRLEVFFKVLQRVAVISVIVVVCVMTALTVVNWVNPDAVIGEDFEFVDIGPVTVELAPEYAPDNGTVLTYAWIYAVLGAVSAAVLWYAFGLIRKILQPVAEGNPFDLSVSRNILKVGYVSIVLGVLRNAAKIAETANVVRNFGLEKLAESGQIRSITANYTVDLGFLVVFFVLLLMSFVFRYGAQLQQLSDETL